jgi:hypothetical protein
MKKTVVVLIALVLCIPVIAFAADVALTSDGKVPGTPFQTLQSEIDQLNTNLHNIQLTPACPPGRHGYPLKFVSVVTPSGLLQHGMALMAAL